jgi:hypothetical protein
MFEPRKKARPVSQVAEGPVPESYRTFAKNRLDAVVCILQQFFVFI